MKIEIQGKPNEKEINALFTFESVDELLVMCRILNNSERIETLLSEADFYNEYPSGDSILSVANFKDWNTLDDVYEKLKQQAVA